MSGLQEIWNHDVRGALSQEKLRAYIEGRLSDAEQHEVERLLSEQSLETDALEGLQAMKAEERADSVRMLNQTLHNYLQLRKRRKRNPYLRTYWSWIAVIVILLVVIIGFVLVWVSR